jgi:formate hydrogenlyase subunit 6/NADH:ubiquinone oxidoreductase subunit I
MIRCLAIKAKYQFHAWDLDQSYRMLHDLESYYLMYHVCCACGVCAHATAVGISFSLNPTGSFRGTANLQAV